ncbi:MAG: ribbon-helix-helix protein, CopG family [Phycisphaerales bacterium]
MARTHSKKKPSKRDQVVCIRASVSFDREDYAELERLAEEKRVSVAWVVRDAVSRYLGERTPLFSGAESAGARA